MRRSRNGQFSGPSPNTRTDAIGRSKSRTRPDSDGNASIQASLVRPCICGFFLVVILPLWSYGLFVKEKIFRCFLFLKGFGRHAVSEKSGPCCPNPRSIITTRVFTTTQILLSRLSRNGLTSLYCLYYRYYKIVYLEVMVLQSVEYS